MVNLFASNTGYEFFYLVFIVVLLKGSIRHLIGVIFSDTAVPRTFRRFKIVAIVGTSDNRLVQGQENAAHAVHTMWVEKRPSLAKELLFDCDNARPRTAI